MKGLEFLKKIARNPSSVRAPVFFFYGEEDFLIDRAVEKIGEVTGCQQKLLFFGDEARFDDIVRNFQETGLFDTSKKFVVLKKAEKFKDLKNLITANYWKSSSPLIVICNAEKKVCIKKINGLERIFVVEFDLLDRTVIRSWVRKKLSSEGIKFDEKTLNTLVSILPPRLREIANELEKIFLFLNEKKVLTLEDIFTVVTPYEEARAYRLYSLVRKKDLPAALKELEVLEASGVQPRNMVTYISSVYRKNILQGFKEAKPVKEDFEKFKKLVSLESDFRTRSMDETIAVELTLLELMGV